MTPMPLSFRRLLRWFIPELKNEDLDRLDSLLALHHHLVLEKNMVSGGNPIQQPPIEKATKQANAILAPYKERYKTALSTLDGTPGIGFSARQISANSHQCETE
jgi:hypothetical protein